MSLTYYPNFWQGAFFSRMTITRMTAGLVLAWCCLVLLEKVNLVLFSTLEKMHVGGEGVIKLMDQKAFLPNEDF